MIIFVAKFLTIMKMKKSTTLLISVIFISALAFASCGNREKKENSKEMEKKECCEKKDSSACEKPCAAAADSTKAN